MTIKSNKILRTCFFWMFGQFAGDITFSSFGLIVIGKGKNNPLDPAANPDTDLQTIPQVFALGEDGGITKFPGVVDFGQNGQNRGTQELPIHTSTLMFSRIGLVL